jgi:hypothetical protein
MENQNEKKISTHLEKISKMTFVENLARGEYNKAALSLPTALDKILDEPPICDVIRVVGKGKVVLFVKAELAKVAARISVGGNMTPAQMEFAATQLVEMFHNESLADFKLCFERGCIGQYGDIFRMDGIVLRKWMEQYLEEKYQVKEDALTKEKNVEKKVVAPELSDERLEQWKQLVDKADGFKKPPVLTEEEIQTEGQEKPASETFNYDESEAAISLREAREKLWRYQEMTVRERHPEWTEEQILERCKELKEEILFKDENFVFPIVAKIWHTKKKKT